MEVVIANTTFQTKYIVASNHNAFIKNANQRLIFVRSCNSLTSGCNPKNIINGSNSQNRKEPKISVKMQVEIYASVYPAKLCLDSGNINATQANKYPVKRSTCEYTPIVKNIVAMALDSADSAIS